MKEYLQYMTKGWMRQFSALITTVAFVAGIYMLFQDGESFDEIKNEWGDIMLISLSVILASAGFYYILNWMVSVVYIAASMAVLFMWGLVPFWGEFMIVSALLYWIGTYRVFKKRL